jgi:hypothetical protein
VIVISALEAPTVVAGFGDVAVVGQPIEQRGGHLGVAEHARPFAEGQIGGGLSEGQITEFIKDDEVQAGQLIGETALPPVAALGKSNCPWGMARRVGTGTQLKARTSPVGHRTPLCVRAGVGRGGSR